MVILVAVGIFSIRKILPKGILGMWKNFYGGLRLCFVDCACTHFNDSFSDIVFDGSASNAAIGQFLSLFVIRLP